MVVYIDILFLINFFMNLFILWTVSFVFICKTTAKRLVLAALISAFLYSVAIMILPFSLKNNLALSIVIESVMVLVAFNPKSLKTFFKTAAFTYIAAIFIGGISFYVWGLFKTEFLSIKVLIVSTLICYAFIKAFIGYADRFFVRRKNFAAVKIFINDTKTSFNALIDTGFCLNRKIIIVEKSKLTLSGNEDFIEIPFKSLGNENGTVLGINADFIFVNELKIESVIIGLYDRKLSKGEFDAIISPEIMEE